MSLDLAPGDLVQVYSSEGSIRVFDADVEDHFSVVLGRILSGERGLVLGRISDRVMDPRYHYWRILFKSDELIGMVYSGFLIRIAAAPKQENRM